MTATSTHAGLCSWFITILCAFYGPPLENDSQDTSAMLLWSLFLQTVLVATGEQLSTVLGPPPCLPSPGVADKESQWDTTASYACNLPGQLNMYVGLLSLSSEQSCYSPHLKSDCLNASGHGSPTSQQSSYPRLGDQPKHSPWVTSQLESCVSLCSNCPWLGLSTLPRDNHPHHCCAQIQHFSLRQP